MNRLINISNRTASRVDLKELETVCRRFLLSRKLTRAELSVVLVGDSLMRRLNRQTRRQDKVTDVLSFRDSDAVVKDKNFLGEIVIDYQQIKRQAKLYQTSVRQELVFILVHGLLHLVGYDDRTAAAARRMERLGRKFISDLERGRRK